MKQLKAFLAKISELFNKLPKEVKVIYYVTSSGVLTLLINDLNGVGVTNPYLIVLLTGLVNIFQYLIIRIGDLIRENSN